MTLSVAELTQQIKRHLEPRFKQLAVQGEISNFKAQSSGHFYFTLKDEQAQIAVSFFYANRHKFPRMPKDGDKVILQGDINVYAPRGNYQFVAQGLQFVGIGDLLLKLHQLKEEIQKLGWFNREHKKLLPKQPKRIGVITSPTGAVIQDIIHVLSRRCHNFHLILYPVKVQGEGAKEEITQAIEEMNKYQICDVLIIGRGGGSIEDLWAFNEKCVAEALFNSKIPTISAVGHETDFTIADFVADVRAPTPSAAAEMVLEKSDSILDRLSLLEKRLDQQIQQRLQQRHILLDRLQRHPFIQGDRLLYPFIQQLDIFTEGCDRAVRTILNRYVERITLQTLRASNLSKSIEQKRHHLELLRTKIALFAPEKKVEEAKRRLQQLKEHLTALNPQTILTKGYCIPKKKGKVLETVDAVSQGDNIELIFHNGTIGATVDGIRSCLQKA